MFRQHSAGPPGTDPCLTHTGAALPTTARKVVFVNRFFYPDHSATSQILSDLVFDLARDGFPVEVVTSRLLYDDASAALPAAEVIRGVTVTRAWSSRLGRSNLTRRSIDYVTFYLSAAWTVWRRIDRHTVLVSKTDPPMLSLFLAPVAKLRRALLVNWLQDLFPEVAHVLGLPGVSGPVLACLRAARNASLRAAHMNVVPGKRMEATVQRQGIGPQRVHVIPNWADGADIVPLERGANPLRAAWGLAERFVVGYSGNLGRAHEFETILAAAEALQGRRDIAFLFIGGGAQRRTVQERCRERGLDRTVLFQPYQPRQILSQSLGVADVHLVSLNPALEGLIVPSKFYGVAAAGRPTLFVGDVNGEIPRVVAQWQCGYAVASGDSAALVSAILRLADDEVLRSRMGASARTLFEREFDRHIAVSAWKALLLG